MYICSKHKFDFIVIICLYYTSFMNEFEVSVFRSSRIIQLMDAHKPVHVCTFHTDIGCGRTKRVNWVNFMETRFKISNSVKTF